MRRMVCALCLAILATCATWPAVAGDKEESKQLFESGLKLMRLDDFVGASATFERSLALYPTQNALFNLANCYRALRRNVEALATLDRLKRDFGGKLKPEIKESVERQEQEIQLLVASLTLETDPADASVQIDGRPMGTGPKLGPVILEPGNHELEAARPGRRSQRRILKLDAGMARSEKLVLEDESGYVFVRANVDGAAVFVDGQWIGTTPLPAPVTLAVGRHVLALRAANREDVTRTFDVQTGEKQVLDIMFGAAPTLLLAPAPPPLPQGPQVALATPQGAPPKSHALKVVAWTSLVGAVAAGAVAGSYAYIMDSQNKDFQKYNDLYAQYGRADDDARRRNAINNMNLTGRVALICGIGAGALAVTSLVAFLVDSASKVGESRVAVSPAGIGVRF